MFSLEQSVVFFRGEFRPLAEATITIANTGLIYGMGVFTGVRVNYNDESGKMYIFRPDEHFKRLRFSCKLCHYKNFLETFDEEKFVGTLKELIIRNKLAQDVYLRVSNFSDEDRVTPRFIYRDTFAVYPYPLGEYVPKTGMKCMVSSWRRIQDQAIPARAKINGAYVNTAFAKSEALSLGFDEAIFLDSAGHVVEGSAENIFLVIDGALITPPVCDDILEGITRKSVMELAAAQGIPIIERSVDRSELYRADEVFLTGTAAKVAPVTHIDSYTIGEGVPGPVCLGLQESYDRASRGLDPAYSQWVVAVE